MTDEEVRVMNSVRRMTGVMAAHDGVFKNNAKAVSLKDALLADIGVLEAAGAAGISARGLQRNATADKNAGEEALDDFLRKMASTARTIKKSEPDFNNTFIVRHGNYGIQELLDVARSFLNDLTPAVASKFTEYGFPSATTANLQARIDVIEAARVQQNTGKGSGIASTAETKAAVRRLRANRAMLKEVGENIVEETGDAGLVAEWRAACKIEKRASGEGNEENPPPAPVADQGN